MRSRIAWLVACALSANSVALAQGESEKRFAPIGPFVFLAEDRVSLKPDGSYVFQHTDGQLVFEAQIAPDVRIVDNFSRQLERVLAKEQPSVFAYSIFGTFLTRLRMYNEDSNPVRTPSYMPKGTIQLARLKNLSSRDPEKESSQFLKGPIEMWLVHVVPYGHHSNGQNGCLFLEQRRVDGECSPEVPSTTTPANINLENGSFSTNYLRVGAEYRRLYSDGDDPNDIRAVTRREWGVGASVELNPSGYGPGSISETLRRLYGPTRYRFTADIAAGNWHVPIRWLDRLNCGRSWANASLTVVDGAASSVGKTIISIEGACLPARWGGAGLFVRYYRGQDYYNAAFLENVNRFQFGVTFLQGKFVAFPKS